MRRWLCASATALTLACAPAHAAPSGPGCGVDFDAAMTLLRLSSDQVDGNRAAAGGPNGLLDGDELALVAAVLNDGSVDMRGSGGVTHEAALQAFVRAEMRAKAELSPLATSWPQGGRLAAGESARTLRAPSMPPSTVATPAASPPTARRK